jgi:hypothetical protein
MNWATRPGCHVDRAACAWLIRRFIDEDASFSFVADVDDIPDGARPFDMPGAELSHRGRWCSFETMLEHFGLADPALHDIGRIVHEADLADELYDAPEAAGLDVIIRGLSFTLSDEGVLHASRPVFDGLYEYRRRANELGTLPS